MRKVLKKIGQGVALFFVFIFVLLVWRWEDITRLRSVISIFAEDQIVDNFSSMDSMFHTVSMDVNNDVSLELPDRPQPMPASLEAFIQSRSVTALVVLKNGELVYENYYQGTQAEDLRISWSVAKSFLSALLGIAVEEGYIASIDDQVTDYAPSLIDTAYDGASIRNVLNMASGVTFNEDYHDFNSDINKMGRVLGLGGSMDEFAASLIETHHAPGAYWQYVSIDTHVLGMVLRGATGVSVPTYLTEKIFDPLGLEADPYYVTDGFDVAFVLGGLNLRTRDFARFGQLILQNGNINGTQIVPEDWIDLSTTPSAPNTPNWTDYGMQWWIDKDAPTGEFFALGIYGQYIYIDETEGVVIALNAADRRFAEAGVHNQNIQMFREIAASLR